MKKIFILALCLIALGSYCLAGETDDWTKTSLSHNISNFHIVDYGVMRGAQPSEEALRIMRECYNVKTILNLRNDQEAVDREGKLAQELDMYFINIPMDATKKESVEKIESCLGIIEDESKRPIFVHCQYGKDRTGLIFAAYRIKYHYWSLPEAMTEMLAYGYDRNSYFNLEKSLIEWNDWRKNESDTAPAPESSETTTTMAPAPAL